ncbi:HpcH/HpaI aldolase/citrate lyase family protein [Microbacterium oxydans]|uniref:HpcH/HpaI aldolase/citrate lyase family protein n=1 Tax=Microbacterium oxydans TaxID=82380 RepID=UPI0022B09450|nr:aldolase/citrate lyase family protein [Microbacterium oxydans]MCZ4302565.1 aldolase/citrate lyase family protein [Microbacterium oxydans]
MIRPIITALYAPADRPERFGKALDAGADAVIVDLEDAVAASRKADARAALVDFAATWQARGASAPRVQVRINVRGSAAHDRDLMAVAGLPAEFAVRVPKTQSVEDIAAVRAALPGRDVHALLESAISIERAFEIARSGVASLATGEADLRAELGIPAGRAGETGLAWSRSRVVNAAAAAGLPAPLMAVYADVADLDGLNESCRAGRALGFAGRTAVHPRQLDVIRRAFLPDAAEIARAREIIDRVRTAAADGTGAFVLEDGTFLDIAMVRAAERVLAAGEL